LGKTQFFCLEKGFEIIFEEKIYTRKELYQGEKIEAEQKEK